MYFQMHIYVFIILRYYATATVEIPLPAMAVIKAVANIPNQHEAKPVLFTTQPQRYLHI
jgi:hypothetical protein